MSNLIIVIGSVTSAVRTEKYLSSSGIINTSVIHTPTSIKTGGCSYSIRTPLQNLQIIRKLMYKNNFRVKGLYSETFEKGERVYRAIS